MKKDLLARSRLYCIIDKETSGEKALFSVARSIRQAKSADIVQLRDKVSSKRAILSEAQRLKKLFHGSKTIFVVNDHLDIAKIVDCDGVHLGQDDLPVKAARQVLGADKIIGVSCHSLKQALIAQKDGADYIGLGPVFSTPTKPDYQAVGLKLITQVQKRLRIPFFVIGGINQANLDEVMRRGSRGIAVCRPVCQGNINQNLKTLSNILRKSS